MYRPSIILSTLSVLILTVAFGSAHAQSNAATSSATAEQVYKNIQILKGAPADQLIPSMQFITSSLGVGCDHCHVEGAFDKDDKKPKQQARQMMQMMFALNQNSFSGQREVTCYSCHRGAARPLQTPVITAERPSANPAKETEKPAPPSRSVEDVLARYLQAVGGAPPLQKISSEIQKGKLNLGLGVQFPVEVFLKQTGMRSVVTHLPSGDSLEVVNSQSGWTLVPGRPLRPMSTGDLQEARIDADPAFAANIQKFFAEFKAKPDEQLGGRPVSVIQASNPKQPPVELYFDQQSGLLVRMVRYVNSSLGLNPTQIDYSDYRDVAGTKQPFQWTVARPQGRFTVQMEQIDVNVPVEDSRFAKPEVAAELNSH